VGLVGKLATDHLAETFEMVHYANVHCEGLPPVATCEDGDHDMTTPVRLYADPERNLLALRSDVPVSPAARAPSSTPWGSHRSRSRGWCPDRRAPC
jgi:uncharacterized protein